MHRNAMPPDVLYLLFPEGRTHGLFALACTATLNIHMLGCTFIILIISAFHCFTVNTDVIRGMTGTTVIRIAATSSDRKALTAGLIITAGMLATHHDVSLRT